MGELLSLRRQIGITQVEMAEAMGLSLRGYQRAEKYGAKVVHILAARWLAHLSRQPAA